MRVKIEITVDIDEQAWMDTYGTSRKEVRADVIEHARNYMHETYKEFGVLGHA